MWRDATLDEMRQWPTLAMLQKHFADARVVRDHGVYMKYQVLTASRERTEVPDTVTIRRTPYGWSSYEHDNQLITSADDIAKLVKYILTLQPGQIVIENGEDA